MFYERYSSGIRAQRFRVRHFRADAAMLWVG
jgi:hypothetical protein